MIKTDITLPIKYNNDDVKRAICARLPVSSDEISELGLIKRVLVLDKPPAHYRAVAVFSLGSERESGILKMRNKASPYEKEIFTAPVSHLKSRPVVVGAGPAGLFAALALAEGGARPIVLERGLAVDERCVSVARFFGGGALDTESNIQFGEGGAGTFSDGKLKVGSHDKYKTKILDEFIAGGADGSIVYSSTAHVGTDRLRGVVKYLRERIISLGGEFIFSAKLTDLIVKDGVLLGVRYTKGGMDTVIDTDTAVLAIGHSARDTVRALYKKGLAMTARPFGIGARIEHPREYINKIVYRESADLIDDAASYHLVTHLGSGRSVYSFCMCPGGTVVSATSTEGAVVTNGMSEYGRDADNSNSALLVSVTPSDFGSEHPLAGIELQERIERCAFSLTGDYKAPSEGLSRLMTGARAEHIAPSYPRGTVDTFTESYLGEEISGAIREGISDFDSWLPGFYLPSAVLTGPETRTTSPIRIERGSDYCAPSFSGVYPVGEGAGYSGGIISSAVDGMKCAEAILLRSASRD